MASRKAPGRTASERAKDRRAARAHFREAYAFRPRSAEERRKNRAVARVMFREAFDLAKKYAKRSRRHAG